MALLPNFPISGDDYTVGKITTVAGSKEFKTKDAYLQSYGAVQAGDHIYIAPAGKFLIIGSITGENSGTLTDPCPADCAVTDGDLRIIFKTASSRLQGRTAMLIERLSKGCLASLAELSPKEGQIFRGTSVEGQLEAVDNTADNVIETDTRKFMTAKDRQSIANIDKRVSDLTLGQIKETDDRKFMTVDERNKIASLDANYLSKSGGTVNGRVNATDGFGIGDNVYIDKNGNINSPFWEGTHLKQHIENRCTAFQNACVTAGQIVGWVDVPVQADAVSNMPSGYVVTASYYEGNIGGRLHICGRQPQIKTANRGWFPLGAW